MDSVIKSELIVSSNPTELNRRLQEVIDIYNEEGLTVRIQNVYSESPRTNGSNNTGKHPLYDYVLVVGLR